MTFISGMLALVTTIDPTGATAPTEFSGAGYSRQPVAFSVPMSGVSKLANPYSFGCLGTGTGTVIGRALFASATATTPILVIPFGSGPRSFPLNGPTDVGDVGSITLFLTAMAGYPDGAAFSGVLTAGDSNVVGITYDTLDEALAPWASVRRSDGVLSRQIATGDLQLTNGYLSVLGGRLLPAVQTGEPATAA